MEQLTKIIVDCTTGEATELLLTDEEISQREADRQAAEARAELRAQEAAATAAAAAAGRAKLAKLGLTEAEIDALLS